MIGLKTRHAVCRIMSKVYPALNNTFEHIREVWISNDFLKFMYQISFKNSGLEIPCCRSFFQADMIFFEQIKVPTTKFGKCFVEIMKPIALLKEFGS